MKGGTSLIYIFIFFILTIAAIEDVRCSKISNSLIFLGYSISACYQCIYEQDILFWLEGITLPVFFLFLFFYLKMMGAGDIKLVSVVGGVVGWSTGMKIFLLALVYGSIWSLVKVIYNRNLKKRFVYLFSYLYVLMIRKERIPYLVQDSDRDSYTIPFAAVVLLAFLTHVFVIKRGGLG